MNKKKMLWLIPILLLAILPACSGQATPVDTFAIYTAAANTVQAELTNAALLTPSPTATEEPTQTPSPTIELTPTSQFSATPQMTATTGQVMDSGKWVSQTVEDGTEFTPGTAFHVTWTLQNVGPTEWNTQYTIKFFSGDQMGAVASVPLPKIVKYNETVDVGVDFIAPATLGAKTSNWALYNASNQFVTSFYIQIIVVAGITSTTGPTVTIAPTP